MIKQHHRRSQTFDNKLPFARAVQMPSKMQTIFQMKVRRESLAYPKAFHLKELAEAMQRIGVPAYFTDEQEIAVTSGRLIEAPGDDENTIIYQWFPEGVPLP